MIHRSSRLWNGTTRCLASLLLLSLTSCAPFPAQAPEVAPSGTKVTRIGDGPARATIRLAEAAYKALATVKRWEVADVHTVTLTLLVRNAESAFVPLAVPQSVTLDLKADPGTTSAAFTGLTHGYYQVQVTAYGDPAGTPASLALNAAPTIVDLDLTTLNDATVTANVALDAVPFDATAAAKASAPTTDGTFVGPSEAVTIEIEDIASEPIASDAVTYRANAL